MKNLKLLTAIAVLTTAISTLSADLKRYDVKSGIIEYTISGSMNIMGMSSKTSGEGKIIFKDWGVLEKSEQTTSTTTMGRTQTTEESTLIKEGKIYTIDHNEKVIVEIDPASMQETDKQDMQKMGKEMLKKMGGKQIGDGKVLGYKCEIWEVMGSKMWIYKGIPLKTEANIMGTNQTMIAKSAKFNLLISDKKFTLPDYPQKTVQQMMQEGGGDQRMPSPEEMKQMQEMMKNFGNMMGGSTTN
ncbi:MAG: hypothetical protein K0U47_06255 [Epsilonproteobacteria bacterium]|nr:hypothetical protein [Campylobacterota bacterium]